MKKMKGKRLLSLLLTLCMVLSLVPVTAFAENVTNAADAIVGDTMVTETNVAPDGFADEFGTSTWKYTDEYVDITKCPAVGVAHAHGEDCYYQSCDHNDGHLSICYGEDYAYDLCEHSNADEHTGSVTLEDVITLDGTDVKWVTTHPAYSVVRAVYDDAYDDVSDEDCTKAYDAAYKVITDAAYDTAYLVEYGKILAKTWSKSEAKKAGEAAGKAAAEEPDVVNAAKAAGDAAVKAVRVGAGWDAVNDEEFCYTTSPSAEPNLCTHTCSELGGECYEEICFLSEHSHTEGCCDYIWTLTSDVAAAITVGEVASVKMTGTANTDDAAIIAAVEDAINVTPAGADVEYTVDAYTTPAAGENASINVTITVPSTKTIKGATKTVSVNIYSELHKNDVTVMPADYGTVTVTNGTEVTAEGKTGKYAETTLTVVADPDRDCYVVDVKVNDVSILDAITDAKFTGTFEVTGNTTVTVTFAEKKDTVIVLKDSFDPVTYGNYKAGDVLGQLLTGEGYGVFEADGVTPVDGAVVEFEKSDEYIEGLDAGKHTVTVVYDGDVTHKDAEKDVEITIKKAAVKVTANNVVVRYNEGYDLGVTAKSENGKNVKTITFIAGLDMADMEILNGEVVFPETVVNIIVPPIKIWGYEVDLPSVPVSLTSAIRILEGITPSSEYVTQEQIDQLIAYLEELQCNFGTVDVMFNGELPKNIGTYLVGAITADPNYETAMGVGSLVITPNGAKADLAWNVPDDNGVIAITRDITSEMLGASVAELYEIPSAYADKTAAIAAANNEIELLFIGMNMDGEIVLTQDLTQEDKLTGAYAEVACIVNWGNEMFYSAPIARTLIFAPAPVDVKFVDGNGNNARLFTYDGETHGLDVLVNGEPVAPNQNLTVTYTGVQADGTTYNSQERPSAPGAYTVTAVYAEKKSNGEYKKAGFAIGAMAIEKQASDFYLEDVTTTYNGIGQFVKVNGGNNTEVLYAVVNRDANTVNVMLPEALRNLMPELNGSIDTAEVKEAFGKVIAAANTLQLPEGFASELAKVEAALAEVPDATVTINGTTPKTVGTYEVHAVTYSRTMKSVYDNATLTINPCPVTITVADKEVVVGNDAPEFTYTVSGILGEYDPHVLLSCEYNKDTATVKEYPITATYVTDDNYAVTVVPGVLKVVAKAVEKVELDKTSVSLYVGNTDKLTATVTPSDATNKTVTWTSSDNSVVTVDETGKITAVGRGTATITATAGGKSATCEVTASYYYGGGSSSSGKGGSTTKYPASVDKEDKADGTITVNKDKAAKGDKVTITVTPEFGYKLDELKVLDKNGKDVAVIDNGDGTFTFVMPADGVEIDATYEKQTMLLLTIDQTIYQLDGTYAANDVAPIIQGDRTMLPIRLIAETLGATVTWNAADKSVTIVKEGKEIVIYIDQPFAMVNGEPVQLDAPAFIANSRTYLPVRFVAESMGATVVWDAVAKTVTILD